MYLADGPGWTGGAELQAHHIARALAERGLRVAHVLLEDPALPEHRDGVDLVLQVPRTRGPRGTRRLPSIWEALGRADASVYVQRSAGLATGVAAAFARAKRRRFVYSISSAADLHRGSLPPPDGTVTQLGLRLADRVVAQTADQQAVATRTLGSKVTLIRSFCEPVSVPLEPQAFLWIGGVIDYKQPLAYLELAQRVPDAQFRMVATERPGWERLADEVHERARSLPNVCLLAPRPRVALLALYAKAIAVVNTSAFEGFPNTFLEAWSCGVPALSLGVDPDGVIGEHGLGAVAGGSLDQLARLVNLYWARRGTLAEGAAARDYVRRHHDPAVVGDTWMELIGTLVSRWDVRAAPTRDTH
jgi:glycosyltransferase involved in cell wall biosynthesis